jgi:hypothetical protein
LALIEHRGVGTIHVSHMNFGVSPNYHVYVEGGGAKFYCLSDVYTISGGASAHWGSELGGMINVSSTTVTLTGTPAFATAFSKASHISVQNLGGNTYSGSATGKRYDVQHSSVVASGGTLPGSVAGTTTTQGQFL